jgi:hypothetical protein
MNKTVRALMFTLCCSKFCNLSETIIIEEKVSCILQLAEQNFITAVRRKFTADYRKVVPNWNLINNWREKLKLPGSVNGHQGGTERVGRMWQKTGEFNKRGPISHLFNQITRNEEFILYFHSPKMFKKLQIILML